MLLLFIFGKLALASQGAGAGDSLPIGTILAYNGPLNKIPNGWALCNGANGTPNLTGRFLEGVTASPGIFKAAGLPNIKGKHTIGYGSYRQDTAYGVFYDNGLYTDSYAFSTAPGNPGFWLEFDASRCSSIYRNDVTTVQPASYTVYYIIKIK